jgi:hypothetical protein
MNRSTAVTALILPLLAAACARDDTPVSPSTPPATPALAMQPELPGTDGEFVRLARQIPGFGGYWIDRDGSMNVTLTDASQESKVRALLEPVASLRRGDRGGRGAASFRFHHADYDFVQLAGWHARLTPVLTVPGVVFTDADETANRIRIGISTPSARAAVEAEVARADVPRAAVIVEQAAPVERTASLSSYTRPVIGGLKILRSDNLYCTLGFNAYYVNPYWGAGVGTRVFFTADHCTATEGAVDGMVFSQGGSRIGVELADPPLLTPATYMTCPSRCRFSDAVAVRYDDGVAWSLGTLARTQFWFSQSPGSLDTDPANPFQINRLGSAPLMGEILGKMGATTGWTAGPVQKTCANQPGSNLIKSTGATLYGLVWANTYRLDPDTQTTVRQFVFSNINNLERDFGYFTAF